MHDRELIEAVLDGNEAAQREFYDRHVERVFALAYRMTGHESTARDYTQTVFIRLFDRLQSFRGEAALSTWVHAVSVSVILECRRKAARIQNREIQIGPVDVAVPGTDPDFVLDEAVRQAICALPARYRTVVVMYDVEGYTHGEIAAALRISAGTSKVRLLRARRRLREALASYAGELAYER